ncbi:GNAT family N-acetyltransferase [Actinoplanes sp. NPDC051859]|uniref:GNAT family N-acetyltransferase n=1 Tax=Actinoplanes sp. NPDC051859 TaxID=3363909 RepID=UPI00378DE85D
MIVIRPQTDVDIDQVAAVHLRSWQIGYAGIVPADYLAGLTQAEFAARRREMTRRGAEFGAATLVGFEAGVVVGFVSFGPSRSNAGVDRAHGGIYALYVEPERWGSGVGQALFAAGTRELATAKYPDLRLWVLAENHRARRFYERAGLRADGERDVYTPQGTSVELPEVRYSGPL